MVSRPAAKTADAVRLPQEAVETHAGEQWSLLR
jgi:hypothetical protein